MSFSFKVVPDNSNLSASVPERVKVLSRSGSSEDIVQTAIPATFSAIELAVILIFVGKSFTAVTTKVNVAESDDPFESVTRRINVPISSASLFALAFGVKVSPSSSEGAKVMSAVKTVPAEVVKTPPVGMDKTVMVRALSFPSASVGAPMLKEAAVSSVKPKDQSCPILGAAFPAGGMIGEETVSLPPPPQEANVMAAKLANRIEE